MLKLSDCGLESFKTWGDNSIFGDGIPLEYCQGQEEVLIAILSDMGLSEYRGIEPGWPINKWAIYIRGGERPRDHRQFCRRGRDGSLIVSVRVFDSSTCAARVWH